MIFISIACKQVDVNKFGKWKHIKMKHFVKIVIKFLIGWSVQHYGKCYCCVTTLCSTVTTFTHFTLVFYFHTPWKLQTFLTFCFQGLQKWNTGVKLANNSNTKKPPLVLPLLFYPYLERLQRNLPELHARNYICVVFHHLLHWSTWNLNQELSPYFASNIKQI